VLFDLGISSFHLEASGRGFSFARDEPLDMRFDATESSRETAGQILATRSAAELASLFRHYGEERFASRIARAVVAARRKAPVATSRQLFDLVVAALPTAQRAHAGRSAARVFQALRIAVNAELEALREALPQAVELLRPGGRLAVIAFHSLEDRLVKRFFLEQQRAGALQVLTKRPIRASDPEIAANPRAASARLRAAERRG
jgi:16S rRNA (cytosine1402-N4)-methyltransferase